MDMTITTLIDRLCCPSYQTAVPPQHDPTGSALAPYLQGQILHAVADSYLRGEPVSAAFNLLGALSDVPELRKEMMRRACNLISVANQLAKGALAVESEVPLSVSLTTQDCALYGFCDFLITGPAGRVTVVDWKPSPRHDGLDQLQVKAYLAAVLTARGLAQGEWVLYYYITNGLRRRSATLPVLMTELNEAIGLALQAGDLRPGTHCTGCLIRKECAASAWTLG